MTKPTESQLVYMQPDGPWIRVAPAKRYPEKPTPSIRDEIISILDDVDAREMLVSEAVDALEAVEEISEAEARYILKRRPGGDVASLLMPARRVRTSPAVSRTSPTEPRSAITSSHSLWAWAMRDSNTSGSVSTSPVACESPARTKPPWPCPVKGLSLYICHA